jgi:5'-3' exoribonuclease 1
MGIPGFFRQVIERIPGAVLRSLPDGTSSLSLDMGGMIHKAKSKVYSLDDSGDRRQYLQSLEDLKNTDPAVLEARFHAEVDRMILEALDFVNPLDSLFIGFDGVAPAGKMQQQRSRREKSSRVSHLSSFDPNSLSPGTPFMQRLDSHMNLFLVQNKLLLPPNVIYSSHLVPGEAEHKIMDYYRSGQMSKFASRGINHVIYGLDADLILLSILSPLDNIFICREDASEVIDIEVVKAYLKSDIDTSSRDVLSDFTVMMSLLGNDFLPHSPIMGRLGTTISMFLDIYRQGQYSLTSGGSINWPGFREFIAAVISRQGELISDVLKQQEHLEDIHKNKILTSSVLPDGTFDIAGFTNSWYLHALSPRNPSYASRIEELTGVSLQPESQDVVQMCIDYCRTIDWVYRYYSLGGSGISHSWGYPHYHTPLLDSIYEVLDGVDYIRGAGPPTIPDPEFTIVHQLLAILPPSSVNLLPLPYRKLMMLGSHISDMYPSDFQSELLGDSRPEMAIPLVPILTGYASRQRIKDAVASVVVNATDALPWQKKEDQIITRTPAEEKMFSRQLRDIQRDRNIKFRSHQHLAESRASERYGEGFSGRGRGGHSSRGSGRYRTRQEPRGQSDRRQSSRVSYRDRNPQRDNLIFRESTAPQVPEPSLQSHTSNLQNTDLGNQEAKSSSWVQSPELQAPPGFGKRLKSTVTVSSALVLPQSATSEVPTGTLGGLQHPATQSRILGGLRPAGRRQNSPSYVPKTQNPPPHAINQQRPEDSRIIGAGTVFSPAVDVTKQAPPTDFSKFDDL